MGFVRYCVNYGTVWVLPAMGMGVNAVWENPTCGIPVCNPKGCKTLMAGVKTAPQKVDMVPQEVDTALQEVDRAPQEVDVALQEADAAPPEVDRAPQEADMAPQEVDTALPEVDMAPIIARSIGMVKLRKYLCK